MPFFIFGKNAHASGIGEKLFEEIKHSNKKYLLLFPQVHSSTKEFFSEWDNLSKSSQESILAKEENSFLPIFLEKNQDIKKSHRRKRNYDLNVLKEKFLKNHLKIMRRGISLTSLTMNRL